ncbi:MAG: response regulator [Luteitalea sp.]|nr:response regulator [Luteitalea sp.]
MTASSVQALEIRVGVVEDDRETRDGLQELINSTQGFRCTGAYRSVEEALEWLSERPADVVLLDIHLPGMSGSDGVRLIREYYPRVEVLMLTVYAEEAKVFEAICNGASGYLLKKTRPARLLEAIRETHVGGSPMSPEIARKVVTLFRKIAPPQQADHELTTQERRLLALLAEGHSYESAGEGMRISVNTVRNYIRSIYEKLHVHSKSQAVSKAIRQGLIY